jgi:phosphoglycolate phosphatase
MHNGTQSILFDLDGTLLDTGLDMGEALNRVLADLGLPALPYERIRPVVSQGTVGLFDLSLGISADDPAYGGLRDSFLNYYELELCNQTTLFEGVDDLLAHLDRSGIPWGVVTNKPEYLAVPLLDSFGLLARAGCVIGGDTLEKRKPDPAPLLHGCAMTGCDPERSVYVGDAEGDIRAGNGAGMKTLVATFGYLSDADHPECWGADGMIDHPREILDWIA